MKPKTLGILAAAAVVLAAIAVAVHHADQPRAEAAALGRMAPELEKRVNDVTALEIVNGKETIRIERGEAGWLSPAHDGFPLLPERVREALIQLTRLERKQALTNRPERWPALEVDTPGGESKARGVKLFAGDEVVLDLVIGKEKWGADPGVYARRAGEDQVWLCSGRVSLPRAATDWMEKKVVQLPMNDIARVVVEHGDETLTIQKPAGETQWALAELPEGRKLKTPNPLGRIAGALGWLSFTGVRSAAGFDRDQAPLFTAAYRTMKDQIVTVRGWRDGDQIWCGLSAAYQPPATEEAAAATEEAATEENAETEGAADAEEAADADQETADQETAEEQEGEDEDPAAQVEEWNAAWADWLYSFPTTTTDLWQSSLEDQLEPLPEAEAEEPAESDAGEEAAPDQDAENGDPTPATEAGGESGNG
ncbi:MAG: DUF4340 domain-containing protein [Planctomycetota bacterium]|nr:MAG: DUF4340 domain-containing protein [Planctomycetota bacterium]